MAAIGEMKFDGKKLLDIKDDLEVISKQCKESVPREENDIVLRVGEISTPQKHDCFLSSREICSDVAETFNSVRNMLDLLVTKINFAHETVGIWNDGTILDFENSVESRKFVNFFNIFDKEGRIKIVVEENGKKIQYGFLEYMKKVTGVNLISLDGVVPEGQTPEGNTGTSGLGGGSGLVTGAAIIGGSQSISTVVDSMVNSSSDSNSVNQEVVITDNNKPSPNNSKPNTNSNSTNNKVPKPTPIIDSSISNTNPDVKPDGDSSSAIVDDGIANLEGATNNTNGNVTSSTSSGFGQMFTNNNSSSGIATSISGVVNGEEVAIDVINPEGTNSPILDGTNPDSGEFGDFGNIYDNESNIAVDNGDSSGGFNPIPLGVGLGLATAAGVGAKVIYDRKKNNVIDDEEQTESLGGNKFWTDDDLSVVHSEEDSIDLDRFDTDVTPSSYSASYTNDVDDINVTDDSTWSIEDESLKNNDQIVDLLNGN